MMPLLLLLLVLFAGGAFGWAVAFWLTLALISVFLLVEVWD